MKRCGPAALVTILGFFVPGATVLQAQTVGHRFMVDGGVLAVDSVPRTDSGRVRMGYQFGGRWYLGNYVYAFGDLYGERAGCCAPLAGLGLVSSRSRRLRLLLRGGYFVPGPGYPVIGAGVEYGGDMGAFVMWQYMPIRTSWESISYMKVGMYWGR